MTRLPRCRPLLAVALATVIAACGQQAERASPPIFPGQPDLLAVSDDFDLGQILGPVPPPRFATLEYEQEIETASRPAPQRQYDQIVSLQDSRGSLGVFETRYEFDDAKLDVTEHSLGVGDMLTLMELMQPPRGASADQATRRYVELIDESTGRLFPLEVGNKLAYVLVRKVQRSGGPPQTLDFAYEFEVARRLPPAVYNSVSIDGPVWVIKQIETGPRGARTERELHFSEQLGMPVYDERTRAGVTTRRYLVAWEKADGQRIKQRQ